MFHLPKKGPVIRLVVIVNYNNECNFERGWKQKVYKNKEEIIESQERKEDFESYP